MLKIISTLDGSTTLRDETLGETYHSVNGAVQESMHVFIQEGLFQLKSAPSVKIFEVGFGTGLNALLTFANKPTTQNIYYHSIETNPIATELHHQLNYTSLTKDTSLFSDLIQQPYNTWKQIRPQFLLYKQQVDLFSLVNAPQVYDLIYYDAFGPPIQPEMWSLDAMQICYNLLQSNGLLVTYCAQGQFKRNLKQIGFKVEELPGPPGKRQITRAIKI